MQHIAQIVATFSHIPGANGRGKGIMTCNKSRGRCCKAKRHLDFSGRQPVSRGKFPGRKSRKGITAQKSITQFLGCYTSQVKASASQTPPPFTLTHVHE